MKIKRFEAANMSGALKLIKQEFGDEAVILSAKSIKKSTGLLSGKRPAKVVVTAAVDAPSAPVKKTVKRKPEASSPEVTADAHAPEGGKLKFLQRFNPITRTGQQKLQSRFVGLAKDTQNSNDANTIYKKLLSQGVKNDLAEDINTKVASLIRPGSDTSEEVCGALSHVIQAQQLVAKPCASDPSAPRIVVLVGPSGVGKTTMAAKLAAMQVRQIPGSVAFLSLDDRRVAGYAELERYAEILGIQLETTNETAELTCLVEAFQHHQLIVVDTPGLAPNDRASREHLSHMVAAMPTAEVHLLLNADNQDGALSKAISFFKPMGIQYLSFTRLDWASDMGGIINQASDFDLPITYLSDTAKVNQGVQWATADRLVDLLVADASFTNTEKASLNRSTRVQRNGTDSRQINYVANRNSDIFHKYDCQSVKRINRENMVAFNDPADAMGRQFKPCRMCCGELHISKPIQRVAYKYASSR